MGQISAACISKRAVSFVGLLFFVPATSLALEIRGLVKGGVDFGGDTLVNVPTASSISVQNIRANEGSVVAGGLSFLNESRNFAVEATFGSKDEKVKGSLQDYDFKRTTLDVLGFYSLPIGETGQSQFRFGAGTTYHIDPRLEETGRVANNKTKFDNAWGLVAQVDTVIAIARGKMGINLGLRYTNIHYQAIGIPTLKAAGIGVFIGVMFPVGL